MHPREWLVMGVIVLGCGHLVASLGIMCIVGLYAAPLDLLLW